MGGSTPDIEDERLDEAMAWLIQLQEERDNPKLRDRFEAWRRASPANERAWAETAHAYDMLGKVAEPPPESTSSSAKIAHLADRRRRAVSRRILAGASVAALAACVAFLALPNVLLKLNADFTTGTAEQRDVRLADGSTVALAPDSAIDVALTGDGRQVRLLAGRAYFEVEPDPRKPFQVEAQGVKVTVVGTGFEVRLAQGGAAVAVRHGAVRVDLPGGATQRSQLLAVGDRISITGGGDVDKGKEVVEQIGIWRSGQLVARDRPIGDVVNDLRPYFNGAIVLLSDELSKRRVTGVYDLRDPVEALRALGRAHGAMTVRQVLPWLVVVSAS